MSELPGRKGRNYSLKNLLPRWLNFCVTSESAMPLRKMTETGNGTLAWFQRQHGNNGFRNVTGDPRLTPVRKTPEAG